MRISRCPKCGAKVAPADTVCLDCGADLVAAQQDIVQEAMKQARTSAAPASPAAAVANPAAAGIALPGEDAEEKRLRVFDRQQADLLRRQRPAMIVILLIALAAGTAMAKAAAVYLHKAHGWAAIKTLSVHELRHMGLDLYGDSRVLFLLTFGLTIACALGALGELQRLWSISQAIAAVERNETPHVLHLSPLTQIGLLLGALCAPPLGFLLGLFFKFSKDEDTRVIGSYMIYLSLLIAAIVLINWLWLLASAALSQKGAAPPKTGADATDAFYFWRLFA